MEWQLPIQKVEIGNINIGSPWARLGYGESRDHVSKPMAPLSYFGTQFRLPFVSLLFPPLAIAEYNAATGKLVLDMSDSNLASIKLNTLQDTIINAIVYHQSGWFKTEFSKEDIAAGFQQIIQNNQLQLYCPADSSTSPAASAGTASAASLATAAASACPTIRSIPFFKDKGWNNAFSAEELKAGTRVRVAVKIHGISFLMGPTGQWTGRCRLQHRVIGIIYQG
jgi:hypothetical protein